MTANHASLALTDLIDLTPPRRPGSGVPIQQDGSRPGLGGQAPAGRDGE